MKTQHKHLIILFTLLATLFTLGNEKAMAVNDTITIGTNEKATAVNYTVTIGTFTYYGESDARSQGKVYYDKGEGLKGPVSPGSTITVSSGTRLRLKAGGLNGYSFVGWTKYSFPVSINEENSYFTITEDVTYTPVFMNLWTNDGLPLADKRYKIAYVDDNTISVQRKDGDIFTNLGNFEAVGNLTVTSGSPSLEFVKGDDSHILRYAGEILVTGGTLTVKKYDEYTTYSNLKRVQAYGGSLFRVSNNVDTNPASCKLIIQGHESSSTDLLISGGVEYADVIYDSSTDTYSPTYGSTDARILRPLLVVEGGTLEMDKVYITKTWNKSGDGGAIAVTSNSKSRAVVSLTNTTLDLCMSVYSGSAIYIDTRDEVSGTSIGTSAITLDNCTIKKCFSKAETDNREGVISATTASTCTLAITNKTKIYTNYTNDKGCISWNSGSGYDLTISNTQIYNNWSKEDGGALYIGDGAQATLTGCKLSSNTAKGNGGGVYIDKTSTGGTLELIGRDTIKNNTAASGGGIYKKGSMKVSGIPDITGNTATSKAVSNVFIPSTASPAYVEIVNHTAASEDGLSCGASIGITKAFTGSSTQIASGTETYHCPNAFSYGAFFDDANTYGVYNPSASPYSSDELYFIDTWKNHASSGGVSGPVDNTYTVSSAAGLAYIAQQVKAGTDYSGKTIQLSADIDLNGYDWEPIGEQYTDDCTSSTVTHAFSGTFDGKGHTISNLSSVLPFDNLGLFGYTTGTVNNVVVSGGLNASSSTNMGGIAGQLNGGSVYNCVSKVTLTGGGSTVIGGLVGSIASGGSLMNSYAITTIANGLVGANAGTVANCYANGASGLYGTNTGTVNYCYYGPTDTPNNNGTNGTFKEVSATREYGAYDNQVTAAAANTYVPTGRGDKSLLKTLNNWVTANSTYASWGRPHTAVINGDYPVLKMDDAEAVASDGTTLYYGTADDMIDNYTTSGEAIYLYKSVAGVNSNSGSSATLYIDEDAAITQDGAITATVGITMKNTQPASATNWDWHMFSPAVGSVPLGVNYMTSTKFEYGQSPVAGTDFEFLNTGYFPTIATDSCGQIDYYCYDEPSFHWINLKRNSSSHWHEDGDHDPITFDNTNASTMTPGRGYLMAMKRETYLQADNRTLNNGPINIAVTKSAAFRNGYNFLGNPYQSYLDFDAFAAYTDDPTYDNRHLWEGNTVSNASYIMLDKDGYTSYARGASENPFGANRYLHPHQGFMIIVKGDASQAAFDNSMRNTSATAAFRDERINYALVNLIVTEADGLRDLTTVELGRPDKGGALKAYDMHRGKGCIYTHYDDEDWSIAFTQPGLSEVGIRFEADEEATFTMTWDMENGDFHYLHLIDNMTGTDIDCLTTEEYRFTATPDDYKSRFRLVFGYTGIEEPATDEPAEGPTAFAFQMGNELVVNGEGYLEIIDVMGRIVRTENLQGSQSTVPMPRGAAGVYVLRLTDKGVTRVQKIVIR